MVLALPELILYCLLFLALAFAFASRKLTQALFGWLISALESVPLIGGKLAGPFKTVERTIVDACQSIENGCDSAMGTVWHNTARLMDWTWKELRSHAAAIASIASPVGALVAAFHGIRSLVHDLTRAGHSVNAAVKTLTREYHGIERRVKSLEQDVSKGIGSDVLPRVRTLEREIGKVDGKIAAGVADPEAAASNDVSALRSYIEDTFLSSATDAITAAVAVALTALGLGGLRCSSLLSSLSKRGCGLWQGLEDVLGLLFDAVIFVDLCAVIPTIEGVLGDVEAPLVDLVSSAANAVCAQPPQGWVTLPAPTLFTPTSAELTATL